MCPHCNYNPDWQGRGLDQPPADYCGGFFEGPTLTRDGEAWSDTRRLLGCPSCHGVWMDY